MTKFTYLLFAGFIMPFCVCAQEVFENEYIKISLPEGMTKYTLPDEIKDKKGIYAYNSGTSYFSIKEKDYNYAAVNFIYDLEKKYKEEGRPVQSRPFNVNGYILDGLVTVTNTDGNQFAEVIIAFDNGRHKLAEAGNAKVYLLDMLYLLADEALQQPKNEKALQSLVFKKGNFNISFDLGRTTEFSVTAATAGFLYYTTSTPILLTASGLSVYFREIKQGAYGTEPNPPFADLLKTEFKEFKKLNPKNASIEEMTIDGYKAALLKGASEDKKEKYCRTNFYYMIEVSPKLVRTISYDMQCDMAEVEQPVIDAIAKSFTEHKNKK